MQEFTTKYHNIFFNDHDKSNWIRFIYVDYQVRFFLYTYSSQVHNFQKLNNISHNAVNFFSNKNKSNLFEWNCLFSSSYSGVTAIFKVMWIILSERPFT